MKFSFILLISLLSLSVFAKPFQQNGIEVIGKASVKANPDQFIFSISINERGGVASKVKALVDLKSRVVVEQFLTAGVNSNAIESSRLSLMPRYEKIPKTSSLDVHQQTKGRMNNSAVDSRDKKSKVVINANEFTNRSSEEKTKLYFEVSRTITVTFNEFELYDQLLDRAVKSGVTNISPLQSMVIDNEAVYQQALFKALINATTKADLIAKQVGVKLGNIIQLKESAYHAPRTYMMASQNRDGFSSQTTQKDVSAQVNVIFAIKKDE